LKTIVQIKLLHLRKRDGNHVVNNQGRNFAAMQNCCGYNLLHGDGMSEVGESAKSSYDPDRLLEALIERMNLKNDAALSRALAVSPPVISKIRHRRLPVTGSLLIRMHEVTNLSIQELRELMGDRRSKFRISEKQFKPKDTAGSAQAA
jgi:plasmid maintenance system antidote protein VapI